MESGVVRSNVIDLSTIDVEENSSSSSTSSSSSSSSSTSLKRKRRQPKQQQSTANKQSTAKKQKLFSFKALRINLDQNRLTRPPRCKRGESLRDWRNSEGEACHQKRDYKVISSSQTRVARQQLIHDFPNAIIDVMNYKGIDQGNEGSCSLVALIHVILLSTNSTINDLLRVSKTKLRRSWKKYWKPQLTRSASSSSSSMTAQEADSSPDLGSTIDMARSCSMFKQNILLENYLDYVPVRSQGNREQSFNQSFFIHNEQFLTLRYKIPKDEYKKMIQIYENAYLIEKSIDNGQPIAINALEHCRVCVGYNQTHLLFADSWSTNYTESNASGSDVNVAGFSVVDKWLVYVWMRDVVSILNDKNDDENEVVEVVSLLSSSDDEDDEDVVLLPLSERIGKSMYTD